MAWPCCCSQEDSGAEPKEPLVYLLWLRKPHKLTSALRPPHGLRHHRGSVLFLVAAAPVCRHVRAQLGDLPLWCTAGRGRLVRRVYASQSPQAA